MAASGKSTLLRERFWICQISLCALVLLACPSVCTAQFGGFCGGCGFFPSRELTFSEHARSAQFIVVGEILAHDRPANPNAPGATVFQVRQVYKGGADVAVYQIGRLDYTAETNVGEAYLIFGNGGINRTVFDRNACLKPTPCRVGYCERIAEMDADPVEHFRYYLPYLESPDPLDDADAFGAFETAEYEDMIDVAPFFPRMKLRKWIRERDASDIRIGVYALMLSMCGQVVDAKLLDEKIFDRPREKQAPDGRLANLGEANFEEDVLDPPLEQPAAEAAEERSDEGLYGLMKGYLLVGGAVALNRIEARVFESTDVERTEVQSVFAAIDFIWSSGNDRISKSRLISSLRRLVYHKAFMVEAMDRLEQYAIWDAKFQVMELSTRTEFEASEYQDAIERYLYECREYESEYAVDQDEITLNDEDLQALRHVLQHPKYARTAIEYLLRAGDWSVQEEVASLIRNERFSDNSTQRAAARYLIECSGQTRWTRSPNWQSSFDAAKAALRVGFLKFTDPALVASAQQADW